MWQSDFTHYHLATLVDVEILTWLDDHSRHALSVTAHLRVTGRTVLDTFRDAVSRHGAPASTLTDNGMVFTTRLSSGKGGRNALEAELRRLGITQKNSRPDHPTTCGKVERFQQTLKQWLRNQPDQPSTIAELQTLLNRFVDTYNHERPHRSLPHACTPAVAYITRPKAGPGDRRDDTHHRVRHDRVANGGNITLRLNGRLHHIAIGRAHTGTPRVMLIADLDVRIIHAATSEILRHLTLNPDRNHQPAGPPTRSDTIDRIVGNLFPGGRMDTVVRAVLEGAVHTEYELRQSRRSCPLPSAASRRSCSPVCLTWSFSSKRR